VCVTCFSSYLVLVLPPDAVVPDRFGRLSQPLPVARLSLGQGKAHGADGAEGPRGGVGVDLAEEL